MKALFVIVAVLIGFLILIAVFPKADPIRHELKADFDNNGLKDDVVIAETRIKSGLWKIFIALDGTDPVELFEIKRFKDATLKIECSDYNEDGNIDVVISQTKEEMAFRQVARWILYGNGNGTFREEK